MVKFSKIIYLGRKSLKAAAIGLDLEAQRLADKQVQKSTRVITQVVSSFVKGYKTFRKTKTYLEINYE